MSAVGVDRCGCAENWPDAFLEHEFAGAAAIDAVEKHGGSDRGMACKG
jgi:hypothetical protein